MLEKLKKRATAALPKVVNGVKALAKKTTKTVVEKFQESKAGKLIGKAVASVPACINNTRNTISKISAAIPKVKQAAKNEVVKRVNTVREEVSKAENTVKTNMAKASNFTNASKSLVTEKAGQEKIKQLFFEKNQRILEKIKEENKIFAADFIKGTTGRGALLYSTSKALKVPIPGAFNLSIEVMNYILQIRKAVVEEYPTIDWAPNVYKELKQESGSYFNQLGNITYNKNIPFLSDLIGAFTNSSDYQKHGNQTPLDDLRYKIINDALIMAKPSLIPGVPGTVIKGIKISQKENVASTEGAYDRGFLIEGAGGMAEGIVNLVISPYETAEGIVNIYKEPEKYIPAILKAANEYVNDKVIHGSAEDRAKLAGRVRFEAMALAASFIGGGAEAPGVLGKTGEITEIGKATEAPGVLGKTGEINEIGKAAGVEQKLTEFNEAAKIAKGAETAGELTKGENLIEELLGKMRKLFKGDIGPEEAGQVANKEAGVSIRKVEVGAEEVGDVGKAVGSEGEVIKGTSNAGKAGEAIEGTGKTPKPGDPNFVGPLKEVDAARTANWTRPDGSTWWPPNDGAVPGTEKLVSLQKGTEFGRIGGEWGSYVAPPNTLPEKLALKPGTDISVYNEYRVIKEIPRVQQAEVAGWFDMPGGGTQYKLPASIKDLLEAGYIELIIK